MQYWHVLESTENHDNEGKKRSRPAEKLNRGTQQLKGNFRFIFFHLFHYRIYYKSLTNEKPGELSRENMMSFQVKITYPHTLNDHRCYGYTVNHDHILKRNGLVFLFLLSSRSDRSHPAPAPRPRPPPPRMAAKETSISLVFVYWIEHYMAVWRYEISFLVFKNNSSVPCSRSWNIFQQSKRNFVSEHFHVLLYQ